MKKFLLISLICLFILVLGFGFNQGTTKDTLSADSYLRIHIRANSNSIQDQNVKYLVKEKVVEYLTPILSSADSKNEAMHLVNNSLNQISQIASLTLQENGYNYTANAKLTNEYFPTRCYDQVVLQSGEYDSLILELGSAEGDNWWCVVYPPLCFVASNDSNSNAVVYRSKILEIIRNFFGG